MGNICCQAEIDTNPLEAEILKFEEYHPTDSTPDDPIIQDWLKNNPSTQSEEDPQNVPKLLKHDHQERYYYGKWEDNVPTGKGFIYEPNHIFYDGQFVKGLPEGKSVIRFLDRKCEFEGQLKAGRAHGEGTIDDLEQKFRFFGQWENSKPKKGILTLFSDPNISQVDFSDFPSGQGSISYKDNRRYTGQIDTTKIIPHGKGSVSFPANSAKSSYEGGWDQGQMHGQGKLVWQDGSTYQGNYSHGRKEGFGKFEFPSKNYYEGYWKDGKQHGAGILFDHDGKELKKGSWDAGQFEKALDGEEYDNLVKECQDKYSQKRSQDKKVQDIFKPSNGQEGREEQDRRSEEGRKLQREKLSERSQGEKRHNKIEEEYPE